MTTRELAERAAQMSTLTTVDRMAGIESFLTIVPDELAKGNIVELGDFGSFWLRTTSEGAETPEEVRAEQIGSVLPRFNPGKEFKRDRSFVILDDGGGEWEVQSMWQMKKV